MDPVTLAFLVAGLALLLSEVKVPGAVAGFFGVGALLTAAVRGVGLVDTIPVSLLVWGITTTALIVPLRPMVKKLIGRSDARKDRTDVDQDRDSMGEVVDVIEDVSEEHDQGRIRFQGTTWQARSTTGSIKKGDKATLVYRARRGRRPGPVRRWRRSREGRRSTSRRRRQALSASKAGPPIGGATRGTPLFAS
jgi:membrane protein implicated in regulation of membrane protease activity